MTFSPAGPRQATMQRVVADARIAVGYRDGATRLARLYQEGAARIRLPAVSGDPLEAVLINTAGGLTGGDRVAWAIDVEEGAALAVTTQACEKVYRSAGGRAEVGCTLRIGARARIAWLPQETIVFDRSAFRRRLDIELEGDAEALLLEATIFGRKAMGESVTMGEFRDRWRVRHAGRLIHAEDLALGPDIAGTLAHRASTGGGSAIATLVFVASDAAERLDAVRSIVGDGGGASAWRVGASGKLLARLIAADGYALRQRLVPLVELLNGRAGLPKTWTL